MSVVHLYIPFSACVSKPRCQVMSVIVRKHVSEWQQCILSAFLNQIILWESFFHSMSNVQGQLFTVILTFYCFTSLFLLQPKHWAPILVLVLLRLIFFPLFALCVIPGAFYSPVFSNDVAPIVICVAFGASNGYLASIAMIHTPS